MNVAKVNFSYKYIRGSVDTRKETVKQLCKRAYCELIKPKKVVNGLSYTKSNFTCTEIKRIINNILPEPINFNIIRNKSLNEREGSITPIFDDNSIYLYIMELPFENGALSIAKVPVLMHELTHMLDLAINPQYKTVMTKLQKKQILDSAFKFYEEVYYTSKPLDKKKVLKTTKQFLKNYTTEEKLLILKYIELMIQTEINGFNSSIYKFAGKMYQFSEKIDLVKDMRKEIIDKERKRNKKSFFSKLKSIGLFPGM